MNPLPDVGTRAEVRLTVTTDMRPAFDGVVVHEVASTWTLAHHMEVAARRVLVPHLEDAEEGIGSHLSIDHVAPAPVGHELRITAEAVEVDATTIVCRVDVEDVSVDPPRAVAHGRQVQRILPRTVIDGLIERARG